MNEDGGQVFSFPVVAQVPPEVHLPLGHAKEHMVFAYLSRDQWDNMLTVLPGGFPHDYPFIVKVHLPTLLLDEVGERVELDSLIALESH